MDFETLKQSNPYRNQQYHVSPWQGFLSALGFRTQADAWNENMAVQAAEYDAALAQKQFDTEYQDPVNQMARMKAAGLNPDINGGQSISSGEPGKMGEDPSTPMQSTGDEGDIMNIATTAANMIMSGFTSGLGLVTSVQGVIGNHLQNRLAGLQNESAFSSFVEDNWKSFLPDFPDDETMVNPFDWKAQALKNAEVFAGTLPKSMRRKFTDQVSRYWESAPGTKEAYKTWKESVGEKRGYSIEKQVNFSQIDDVLDTITSPLADAMEKIAKQSLDTQLHSLEAQDSESKDSKQYFDSLDSKLQAESENSANKLSKTNNDAVATLNASLDSIVQGLKRKSEEGGIAGALCQFALVTIASVRLWLANQGAPSVSRSSSSGTNNYGADSYNQSSFRLNF